MNATAPMMIAAIVAPASGIRSRIATIKPSATANGTPSTKQDERRQHARDQADQQVARDVAADRAVDVAPDLAPARLRLRRQERVEPLDPRRAFEQHEERQEDDRDVPMTMLTTPFVTETAVPDSAEQLLRAAVVDLLAHLLDDVVLRLEEAEPPLALRQVVDVAGTRVDELVHVVDERRDEERADAGDDERSRAGTPIPGGEAAALDAAPLEQLDERVHREREEERDRDPARARGARPRAMCSTTHDRDREREDRRMVRDAEADDALGHRAENRARTGRFRPRFRKNRRPCRFGQSSVEQELTLPDGRTASSCASAWRTTATSREREEETVVARAPHRRPRRGERSTPCSTPSRRTRRTSSRAR